MAATNTVDRPDQRRSDGGGSRRKRGDVLRARARTQARPSADDPELSVETGDEIGRGPVVGAAVGAMFGILWIAGFVGLLGVLAGAVAGFLVVGLVQVAVRAAKGKGSPSGDTGPGFGATTGTADEEQRSEAGHASPSAG